MMGRRLADPTRQQLDDGGHAVRRGPARAVPDGRPDVAVGHLAHRGPARRG